MKKITTFVFIWVFIFTAHCVNAAAPDNFLGVGFNSTYDQYKDLTKLPPDFRPMPENIQYYRSGNMEIGGKDIGSVYFGFNTKTGEFYSADFAMDFVKPAKRTKAIKWQDGSYKVTGQISMAQEYFNTLCSYFEEGYGSYKIKEQTINNQQNKAFYYKTAEWEKIEVSDCTLYISVTIGGQADSDDYMYVTGTIIKIN